MPPSETLLLLALQQVLDQQTLSREAARNLLDSILEDQDSEQSNPKPRTPPRRPPRSPGCPRRNRRRTSWLCRLPPISYKLHRPHVRRKINPGRHLWHRRRPQRHLQHLHRGRPSSPPPPEPPLPSTAIEPSAPAPAPPTSLKPSASPVELTPPPRPPQLFVPIASPSLLRSVLAACHEGCHAPPPGPRRPAPPSTSSAR